MFANQLLKTLLLLSVVANGCGISKRQKSNTPPMPKLVIQQSDTACDWINATMYFVPTFDSVTAGFEILNPERGWVEVFSVSGKTELASCRKGLKPIERSASWLNALSSEAVRGFVKLPNGLTLHSNVANIYTCSAQPDTLFFSDKKLIIHFKNGWIDQKVSVSITNLQNNTNIFYKSLNDLYNRRLEIETELLSGQYYNVTILHYPYIYIYKINIP